MPMSESKRLSRSGRGLRDRSTQTTGVSKRTSIQPFFNTPSAYSIAVLTADTPAKPTRVVVFISMHHPNDEGCTSFHTDSRFTITDFLSKYFRESFVALLAQVRIVTPPQEITRRPQLSCFCNQSGFRIDTVKMHFVANTEDGIRKSRWVAVLRDRRSSFKERTIDFAFRREDGNEQSKPPLFCEPFHLFHRANELRKVWMSLDVSARSSTPGFLPFEKQHRTTVGENGRDHIALHLIRLLASPI